MVLSLDFGHSNSKSVEVEVVMLIDPIRKTCNRDLLNSLFLPLELNRIVND